MAYIMRNPDMVSVLKALGHETRLNIIKLLLGHNLCVGALARNLDISEAAVSQHLQILRKAGLVKGEKIGYWTHYTVQKDMIGRIGKKLTDLAECPTGLEGIEFKSYANNDTKKHKEGKSYV